MLTWSIVSSASSDSDVGEEVVAKQADSSDKDTQRTATESRANDSDSESAVSDIIAEAPPGLTTARKQVQNPELEFEAFYLRQATKELANDLDKLRSASDFRDNSVSMLVDALKQGTACFSQGERVRIGSAVGS